MLMPSTSYLQMHLNQWGDIYILIVLWKIIMTVIRLIYNIILIYSYI